jgi:hypothetical protein
LIRGDLARFVWHFGFSGWKGRPLKIIAATLWHAVRQKPRIVWGKLLISGGGKTKVRCY